MAVVDILFVPWWADRFGLYQGDLQLRHDDGNFLPFAEPIDLNSLVWEADDKQDLFNVDWCFWYVRVGCRWPRLGAAFLCPDGAILPGWEDVFRAKRKGPDGRTSDVFNITEYTLAHLEQLHSTVFDFVKRDIEKQAHLFDRVVKLYNGMRGQKIGDRYRRNWREEIIVALTAFTAKYPGLLPDAGAPEASKVVRSSLPAVLEPDLDEVFLLEME